MVFEAIFALIKDSIYENHDLPPPRSVFGNESLP